MQLPRFRDCPDDAPAATVRGVPSDALAELTLDGVRAAGLHRSLRRAEGRIGPRQTFDGRSALMLAGANYLDLAGDPRVVDAAQQALGRYGAASGGSRLINGNLDLHESLESELADFCGAPAALVFSTGYMANLGVLCALAGKGDAIVSDALNHASIVDACRLSGARTLVFRHNDAADLERALAQAGGARRRVLALDGVYSMDGDVAQLAELAAVARAHGAIVVLDDAHGIGVLGARGRGTAERQGVQVDILIGNLGKAFGSFGAFAACAGSVRDYLVNVCRSFIFTCALPPAALGAARAALAIACAEPWRRRALLARAERLRTGLRAAGYSTGASATHIVPAFAPGNARVMSLCEAALERGVYAQGIRYPSVPKGAERLRLAPSCAHSEADIDFAVGVLRDLRAQAGLQGRSELGAEQGSPAGINGTSY